MTRKHESSCEEIFDEELYRRSREAVEDFLTRRWHDYLALVERMECHPGNRHGADKTWVERSQRSFREHYRRAARVR